MIFLAFPAIIHCHICLDQYEYTPVNRVNLADGTLDLEKSTITFSHPDYVTSTCRNRKQAVTVPLANFLESGFHE